MIDFVILQTSAVNLGVPRKCSQLGPSVPKVGPEYNACPWFACHTGHDFFSSKYPSHGLFHRMSRAAGIYNSVADIQPRIIIGVSGGSVRSKSMDNDPLHNPR